MKVKRTAFHYRYYCFLREAWKDPFAFWEIVARRRTVYRGYQPSSLCRYFWFCVASFIALPVVALIMGALFVIAMVTLAPIGYALDKAETYTKHRRQEKGLDPHEPGVVRSFFKAKKAKVCPLIEVVD